MFYRELVTVITPIYNQQDCLVDYIKKLKTQTYGFKFLQIILVNDGSTDSSGDICLRYAKQYKNVFYIEQENIGVSAARNNGIRHAKGKYIFFLDADDSLSKNAIEDCVNQFDKIYDHVDLLTYPIETYYKGRHLAPHFRYKYLKDNGSYNLCDNAFIGQTTMNIVVKNQFENNILFDESLSFSEDQKYCCEVLKRKLEMGFCNSAKYIYNRSDESSSGKLSGACFIFESSLKLFEDLFAQYEYVPLAFQGLFVNDIYWKLLSNIYFPYHYSKDKYRKAIARVRRLLRRCDNYVILNHPNFDYFEKFYLIRLKGSQYIEVKQTTNQVFLLSEGNQVLRSNSIEIVVTKLSIEGTKIRLLGFLKSVFFQFYKGAFTFFAIENGKETEPIQVLPSVHNYYLSHEPTQRFWQFEYECDVKVVHSLIFKIKFDEALLGTSYYFMPLVPINKKFNEYSKDIVMVKFEDNKWQFSEQSFSNTDKNVWLYYDCAGVEIDNGLKQFLHDSMNKDEVERYYILTDKKQKKHIPANLNTVVFGSKKHVKLLLQASKVITAFIENNNIFPFPQKTYYRYANQMHFETIYLQHGVLHIDMPWKYSPEKIIADKVVVSSNVDYHLFNKNGFRDDCLWKVGMPRFDELSKVNKANDKRILFAPSWRSYLVGSNKKGKWQLLEGKFFTSNYYIGIKSFLESECLSTILAKYGYELDVKIHPIFRDYASNFSVKDDKIHLKDNVNEEDYILFITDFSSYMFDFLYMGIPVLSFIPDDDEFRCGMNGYRNVDFMNCVSNEEIANTVDDIIVKIEEFIRTGEGMHYSVEFLTNGIENSADMIYKKLTGV